MIINKLKIDEKDARILSILFKDNNISQTKIAKLLNISQPSINLRINKLRKKGVLSNYSGIDLSKTDVVIARVDFTAINAEKILNNLRECSFFVNGFLLSGKTNASIMIAAPDLKKVEAIVNKHLRTNKSIKEINIKVIVSTTKPFTSPLNLEQELHQQCQNSKSCNNCPLKD